MSTFKVQGRQNAVPLEGGPSTGKSTLMAALQALGHNTLQEVATPLIQEGNLLPERDRYAFQLECYRRQLEAEQVVLGSDELWFLDRGHLIGPAHFWYEGKALPGFYAGIDVSHYAFVLLLEPLSEFEHNGVRRPFENLEFAHAMTPLIERSYVSRGVEVIRVPDMSVADRLAFVTEQVQRRIRFA